jgi:hypothetical protein
MDRRQVFETRVSLHTARMASNLPALCDGPLQWACAACIFH